MVWAPYPRDDETVRRLLARWTLAGLCVALVYSGVALAVGNWPKPESTAGDPPAAIMIELSPLPVAPETLDQDLAVGPQEVMSETSTPSERKDKPAEKTEKQEPVPEPDERVVKTEVELQKLDEVADADAVLAAAAKKPPLDPERVEKKQLPEKSKDSEQRKPQDEAKKAAKTTAAPKPIQAPRAKTNAAPTSGISSSVSIATWRGAVMAHLNRLKRYPGGGAGGTSSVAFTIERSGRVLSARLIGSSGSAVLDQEAVALAHRASPVPAPPNNIGSGSIVLTVPIRFSR